jgi:hypothetical protein
MLRKKLQLDHLHVDSFELGAAGFAPRVMVASEPTVVSDPSTYEDTCITICPTDDTCTMLGCTKAALT